MYDSDKLLQINAQNYWKPLLIRAPSLVQDIWNIHVDNIQGVGRKLWYAWYDLRPNRFRKII